MVAVLGRVYQPLKKQSLFVRVMEKAWKSGTHMALALRFNEKKERNTLEMPFAISPALALWFQALILHSI